MITGEEVSKLAAETPLQRYKQLDDKRLAGRSMLYRFHGKRVGSMKLAGQERRFRGLDAEIAIVDHVICQLDQPHVANGEREAQ